MLAPDSLKLSALSAAAVLVAGDLVPILRPTAVLDHDKNLMIAASLLAPASNNAVGGFKSVMYLTKADAIAAGRPNVATLDQLSPLTVVLGNRARVDQFRGAPGQELIAVYDDGQPATYASYGHFLGYYDGTGTPNFVLSGDSVGLCPLKWVLPAGPGALVANVPLYSTTYNAAGTPPGYVVSDVVRYALSGVTGLYQAAVAGQLPAPTSATGDANWLPFISPVPAFSLSQSLTLATAGRLAGNYQPGRLYLITGAWNGGDPAQVVAVRGLSPQLLDVLGTVSLAGARQGIQNINVTAATFDVTAGQYVGRAEGDGLHSELGTVRGLANAAQGTANAALSQAIAAERDAQTAIGLGLPLQSAASAGLYVKSDGTSASWQAAAGGSSATTYQTVTLAQAQAALSGAALVPSCLYAITSYVTDPNLGAITVLLVALAAGSFAPQGFATTPTGAIYRVRAAVSAGTVTALSTIDYGTEYTVASGATTGSFDRSFILTGGTVTVFDPTGGYVPFNQGRLNAYRATAATTLSMSGTGVFTGIGATLALAAGDFVVLRYVSTGWDVVTDGRGRGGTSGTAIDPLDLTAAQMTAVMGLTYTNGDAPLASSPTWSITGQTFDALSGSTAYRYTCGRGNFIPGTASGTSPIWARVLKS